MIFEVHVDTGAPHQGLDALGVDVQCCVKIEQGSLRFFGVLASA